jgi:hypothetical protein
MQGLRMALAQLNKEAPGAVLTDENKVWTDLSTDVAQFRAALANDYLEEAILHYKGPFLEGFDLSGVGEELEEWIFQTRERLAAQVREAHVLLAERAGTEGDYKQAACQAELAYLLRSAPEPNPKLLERIYVIQDLRSLDEAHVKGRGTKLRFEVVVE